jgi:hypothetical protein
MELVVFRPPPGTWKALDTVAVLTDDQLDGFAGDDYKCIFGYSRRDGEVLDNPIPGGEYGDAVANGCNSLAISTSRRYLSKGFALSLVQFGAFGSASYGTQMGRAAASASRRLGFPGGHHHFCDVEGRGPQNAGPAKVKTYVEAYSGACTAGGSGAPLGGMYYNFTCMDARQLYAIKGITCYWAAAGPVPPPPYPRGNSVEQRAPSTHHGVEIDRDTIRTDRFGEGPVLVGTPEIVSNWYADAIGKLTDGVVV